MLTKLKKKVQQLLSTEAKSAHDLGLTPNMISVIGITLSFLAAVAYGLAGNQSWVTLFGVGLPLQSLTLLLAVGLLLASGFSDTLDGVLARNYQQVTPFGGFLDSLFDRYADAIVFSGIIIGGLCDVSWGLGALAGSMLVSYSRARAEAAGIGMESVGLAERAERILILAAATAAAVFWLPSLRWGIILIAVLSNFTVLQRGLHVYRWLKKKESV
ncbi:CDP-alcohol phosphatidyltransferase family protein [Candidatus Bathyarchaeota archaeon]|nr:CDP-alcohol phosphatidyltransferase family protein [Candidatus Bathyarchaeota archaeon]